MYSLRDYQQECIDAIAKQAGAMRRILAVCPTASGKAIIAAFLCKRLLDKFPNKRILQIADQEHLMSQNEEKVNAIMPHIKTGMYCASAGRKQTEEQIIFASRDSLARNPTVCGEFEIIVIDEAHMVASDAMKPNTNYGKIFSKLSPKWIFGFTGTPWRLSGGRIWGDKGFFECIAYNIPMGLLIERGFLVPYIFPKVNTHIQAKNLKAQSTGDYRIADLEAITMGEKVIKKCLTEWHEHAADRVCSLFFCVSVAHAEAVHKMLCASIGAENCAFLDGSITGKKRVAILQNIKAGKFKAVTNCAVLNKGFDAPIIDCIVMLRPTKSPSLYVQSIGRGLRISPETGKINCLILEFTDNYERFGSLETPLFKATPAAKKKDEDAPLQTQENQATKTCEECGYTNNHPRATKCQYCGEPFVYEGELYHNMPLKTYKIENVTLQQHRTNAGEPCVRAVYKLSMPSQKRIGGTAPMLTAYEYFMIARKEIWIHQKFNERRASITKAYYLRCEISGKLIKKAVLLDEDNAVL